MTSIEMSASPELPHPSRTKRVVLALSDIKFAHTVFALPFALLGAFVATPAFQWGTTGPDRRLSCTPWTAGGGDEFPFQLLFIVICMVLARTWAMLVNRVADAKFDAANPRTALRAIARGELSGRDAALVAGVSGVLFLLVCAYFWPVFANPWPAIFAPLVLGWLALYSFTKRFTALSHVVLGASLALAPIAAAVAIHPEIFGPHAAESLSGRPLEIHRLMGIPMYPAAQAIVLISGFVLFWVAGFDVAYALQDLDFDRRTGLRSIPARLGVRSSLWVARALHALAFVLLLLAWRADPRFGSRMLAAAVAVGALLVYEHVVLARRGVAGLPLAFGTLNGVISVVLGIAGCVDVVV